MHNINSIERVIDRWKEWGTTLVPPASEEEIRKTFQEIGRPLSSDIVQLYGMAGGVGGVGMDEYNFRLWPIELIKKEGCSSEPPYTMFADWLIRCECYCLKYESEEISSVYVRGSKPARIAGSVFDFFDLYLNEPERLGWLSPEDDLGD